MARSGLVRALMASRPRAPMRRYSSSSAMLRRRSLNCEMSAPATKALSPAPRMMTTRMASSVARSWAYFGMSSQVSTPTAFRFSGRLKMIQPMGPSFSIKRLGASLMGGLLGRGMVTGNTLRQRAAVCYRDRIMSEPDVPEHVQKNRVVWDALSSEYAEGGRRAWARAEPTWGIWRVPEAELQALPDVTGKDVIELGCGTAYFGAWLKKAGAARVVGIDPTPAQLETARRCNERFGLGLEFVEAFGEDVPLPDESFDVAVSEYGASIWADPYKWIPEAARLLRPGGELVFLRNSTLVILCSPDEDVPATETLQRPQFGMHRFQWPGEGIEYHL